MMGHVRTFFMLAALALINLSPAPAKSPTALMGRVQQKKIIQFLAQFQFLNTY
uniref:Uncharacterized protein n=1 Tax=Anguilla anguilla TaxID=7936 RepID=A0A0E9SX82_ANGAN